MDLCHDDDDDEVNEELVEVYEHLEVVGYNLMNFHRLKDHDNVNLNLIYRVVISNKERNKVNYGSFFVKFDSFTYMIKSFNTLKMH